MNKPDFHVLIIGGGIGGLCLAQGLKRAGISFAVYERDDTPDVRLQGYRLNIEPPGSRALHACLPSDLWSLLVATSGDPGPRMGVFDEQLHELMQEDEPGAVVCSAENAHYAVSRITLRRILLTGLDDFVHFDKEFMHYDQVDGKVKAFFADGSISVGDLLVGADGSRSRVRRQLLPDAHTVDTPAVGIGGKLYLTAEATEWLPQHMMTAKNMILPPRDFLFTAAFRGSKNSQEIPRKYLVTEYEDRDYVMWAFVAHRSTFPSSLKNIHQRELRSLIEWRMTNWHSSLRQLITKTDATTVQAFDFSAAARIKPWSSTNVTLLGDALHCMPPVGGMGGNAALHDASLLCAALTSARNDESSLTQALHACEASMIESGFKAVRASLLYTRLAISQMRPLRLAARTFFRACGALPRLRKAVFQES